MKQTHNLKPCPFCGDTLVISNIGMATHIDPFGCTLGAMGVPSDHAPSVKAWNTRVTPKVKPLVWGTLSVEGDRREASTPWGSYVIRDCDTLDGSEGYMWSFTCIGDWDVGDVCWGTISAARDDAQLDYDTRYTSVIEGNTYD